KFKPKRKYQRNGKTAYLDYCREILVPATPEEAVRQSFIMYLTKKLGYPAGVLMETEVSVSHFKKGAQGRADIIGYYPTKDGEQERPLYIVECKAPDVLLTDETFKQCATYDRHVKTPGYLFLTNGKDTRFYCRRGHTYELLKTLPSHKTLLKKNRLLSLPKVKPFTHTPFPFKDRTAPEMMRWAINSSCWVGRGSPKAHHGFLMSLNALVQSDRNKLKLPLAG
ncbi:MAG: type I restriction enzyme HsdR N-terminal domain-containing protein, partial [bacterium]